MSHRRRLPRRAVRVVALAAAGALLAAARPATAQPYAQTNLVSSVPGLAPVTDPQLVNPWGISFSGTSPFWVSDAGTGVSTLYNAAGVKQGLVVTIPGPGGQGPGVPTGQVFNNAASFALGNGANATFMFASVRGTITGWNGAAGTTALIKVDQSASGAAYTGLAIAGSGATARLYAANFGNGRVDVFDGGFNPVLAGSFLDPNLPAGYAPFNVQTLAGSVYVTYALKDPLTGEDLPGAGHGFVDVFNTDGVLQRRVVTDGVLDSPWGLAIAPASFGPFGGALLVGNFGDGTIHAFDNTTGALLGALTGSNGSALVNEGLWAIAFGNNGAGSDPNSLYITAGINDETGGLFARISAVPEPQTVALVGTGLAGLLVTARRRRSRR
jgi:uncharacterized protein (TIGR03118 family)